MSKLLFEIGTEELPAGFIASALRQLEENFTKQAEDLKISYGKLRTLATPRRLTLIVDELAERQADIREELIGPSVKAGLDENGKPTKAAEGFAKSKGAQPEDLKVIETPKGEYLMLIREVEGKNVEELLPVVLQQLILKLTFPKSMRWGSNSIAFARPIQWLLAINNDQVVVFEHEGLTASNTSMGHRFHNNHTITIQSPESYEEQLADAKVIVDQEKRKQAVVDTITTAVADSDALSIGRVFIDENLLDTVTNLVEQPCGICGSFNEKFLQLPDDVLITSMREHQKYFPIVGSNGNLLAGFVAVNNTNTLDTSLTRQGHQRVLRARLEDALFFFNSDRQRKLDDFIPQLEGIIFQAKLGTMGDKCNRIVKLTRLLAEMVAPELADNACRAAEICKVDLLTDMVGEFPSLQGIMGHAYAEIAGEDPDVALAIKEHYMPKRSGAELPTKPLGALVGLADRFDTLAGCFGIGQVPTGTADPFGLRRISLAILHIIKEYNFSISLREVVHKALALYGDRVDGSSTTVHVVLQFIEGRYRNDYIAKGFNPEAVAAALAVDFDNVNVCTQRVEALASIQEEEVFSVLASSYKRIRNITKDNTSIDVDTNLLTEKAEKNLYTLLQEVQTVVQPKIQQHDYLNAMQELLRMKEPVDVFFDEVMVMAEDTAVRQNRLNLLTALRDLVLQIGDISLMHEG